MARLQAQGRRGSGAAWLRLGCTLALSGCLHRAAAPVSSHSEPELVGVTHSVLPGETLWRISRAYGLGAEEVAAANGIADPAQVRAGTELFIPGATEKRAVPPLPLGPPSGAPPPPADPPGLRPLRWPLLGVLYARFGPRTGGRHDGVDIAAPEGAPIGAAAEGVVIYAGEQEGYGRMVIVEHSGGFATLYAHNRENLVKEGQRVAAGQPVAKVGRSGRTSGPHLHFEVRMGADPVDPLNFLPLPR